ncbi:MAG: hypothetical protein K6T85_07520 [Gorillibacterium sp.]|nr:hypothetical protein [Gorillibacterium sp.]
MDNKLTQDTLTKLEKHMNSAVHIRLVIADEELVRMDQLLANSRMKRKRKMAVLGSYVLLYMALLSHRQIDDHLESGGLNRDLLDGDYLFGSYIRWLIDFDDNELLAYLSPVHKRIQIQFMEGLPFKLAMDQLFEHYRLYLSK